MTKIPLTFKKHFSSLTWPDIIIYLSLTLAGSATFTMFATIIGFYVKNKITRLCINLHAQKGIRSYI